MCEKIRKKLCSDCWRSGKIKNVTLKTDKMKSHK